MNESQMIKQTHEMVSQLVSMVADLKNEMQAMKDRLAQIEIEVRGIKRKEEEQDRIIDVLSVRTTRLEANWAGK